MYVLSDWTIHMRIRVTRHSGSRQGNVHWPCRIVGKHKKGHIDNTPRVEHIHFYSCHLYQPSTPSQNSLLFTTDEWGKIKKNNQAQNSPRTHTYKGTLKSYSLFISLINILETGQSMYGRTLFSTVPRGTVIENEHWYNVLWNSVGPPSHVMT